MERAQLTIGLLLVSTCAGCGGVSQQEFKTELARVHDQLRISQAALDKTVKALEQQNSILHRALGKHIPIEIPPDLRDKLKSIDSALAAGDTGPRTSADAEALCAELAQLTKTGVPPWAEEELNPLLNRLRWSAKARATALSSPPLTLEDQATWAERGRLLLTAAPEGVPEYLTSQLQCRTDEVQKTVDTARKKHSLEAAKRALEDKKGLPEALALIQDYRDDENADKLAKTLEAATLQQKREAALDRLAIEREAAGKLPKAQQQHAATLKVYELGLTLLHDLKTDLSAPPELVKKAEERLDECADQAKHLAGNLKADEAKKVRDYQKWALEQIDAFDKPDGWHYDANLPWVREQLLKLKSHQGDLDFRIFHHSPACKDMLVEKFPALAFLRELQSSNVTEEQQRELYSQVYAIVGWNQNIDQELSWRLHRDKMAALLLPINPNLLDTPVSQVYHRAFQKAWAKLEGRADQLEVAKQSAVVEKKGID